jgi:hypothetical protein
VLAVLLTFLTLSPSIFAMDDRKNNLVFDTCVGNNDPMAWSRETDWSHVKAKTVPTLKLYSSLNMDGVPEVEFSKLGLFRKGRKVCNVARGVSYTEPLLVDLKTSKKKLSFGEGTTLPPTFSAYYRYCDGYPIFTKSMGESKGRETLWLEFDSINGKIIKTKDKDRKLLYLDISKIKGFMKVKRFKEVLVNDVSTDCKNFKIVLSMHGRRKFLEESDASFNLFKNNVKNCYQKKSQQCLQAYLYRESIIVDGFLIRKNRTWSGSDKYLLTDMDWDLLQHCMFGENSVTSKVKKDSYRSSYTNKEGLGVECSVGKNRKNVWQLRGVTMNHEYNEFKLNRSKTSSP